MKYNINKSLSKYCDSETRQQADQPIPSCGILDVVDSWNTAIVPLLTPGLILG